MAGIRAICIGLLAVGLSVPVLSAVPQACLQLPERNTPCPHLLYKKSREAISGLNVPQNGLLCICLSDIKPLLKKPRNPTEKAQQQWQLAELQRRFQLDQAKLEALIRE